MSTFLELCQNTALESGVFGVTTTPSAVTGQTGRLLRLVNWVKWAWEDIQRSRSDWRWMRAEFSGPTVASQQEYTAANLGISSRFANWIHHDDHGDDTFSLYLPADGQATEGYLRFIDWPDYRRIYKIGSNATREQKPQLISINDSRNIELTPIPDAIYTLRGRYRKTPQVLAADGDTPECPSQFHEIIMWRALDRMSTFEESMEQKPFYRQEYRRILGELVNDQTPRILMAEPFA